MTLTLVQVLCFSSPKILNQFQIFTRFLLNYSFKGIVRTLFSQMTSSAQDGGALKRSLRDSRHVSPPQAGSCFSSVTRRLTSAVAHVHRDWA